MRIRCPPNRRLIYSGNVETPVATKTGRNTQPSN